MSDELEAYEPVEDGHETLVEVLAADFPVPAGPRVRLTDDAAREVTDLLGNAAKMAVAAHGRAQALFLVSPSREISKQLSEGSLRWANSRTGDASVLIKNSETGRIAGQGRLVRQNLTKVLGPAAWQAMAMATQQHYLVSIDNKLSAITGGIDQLQAENRDERLGELDSAARTADRVLQAVADEQRVSEKAVTHLVSATQQADERFHHLLRQATRHVERFARDEGEPGEAEQAWEELLYAVQVLNRCSLALVSLPYADVDELEATANEERQRISAVAEQTFALAGALAAGDEKAREGYANWELNGFHAGPFAKDAAIFTVTSVMPFGVYGKRYQKEGMKGHLKRYQEVPEPKLKALDPGTTETLEAVTLPAAQAPPMLVAVNDDGSVEISVYDADREHA